jgi:serine/threonine protein kinase
MTKRYDLLDRLGEGGAGAVFKAWDTRLQRYVAIKRLLPADQRESDGVGTDLKKEAAALSALQHPNIVSVYDLDEIDGEPVVIMEFLNGETLEQTMRRGALNIGDFASVARQALEGLVAAHRLGVQHRDIKPSNIMVNWLPNGDFLVKVLDFGLADFTAKPQEANVGDGDSAYGSVHFMAPEQFTRQPVDARTDIYSLGCVFYYALTSAFPFTGRKMEDIIDAHLKTLPQPLMKLRQDIPKGLADWIAWLMNRDPEKRPQNAEEALEAFRLLQAGKTGKARPQTGGVRQVTGPVRVPQSTSSSAAAPQCRRRNRMPNQF